MSKENERMSTSDIGLSRLGQITGERLSDAELQRGIDRTLREITARPYNPQALDPPEKVKVAVAPTVVEAGEKAAEPGWYEPKKLGEGSSYTDQLVKKLTDELLPHEPGSPLRGGEKK